MQVTVCRIVQQNATRFRMEGCSCSCSRNNNDRHRDSEKRDNEPETMCWINLTFNTPLLFQRLWSSTTIIQPNVPGTTHTYLEHSSQTIYIALDAALKQHFSSNLGGETENRSLVIFRRRSSPFVSLCLILCKDCTLCVIVIVHVCSLTWRIILATKDDKYSTVSHR